MANTDPAEVEQQLWSGVQGSYGLDIGARQGESIDDFKRVGCTTIACFEPSTVAFPILRQRAQQEVGVLAYDIAISDHDGTVDLAVVPLAHQKGELVSPVDGMEWSVRDWSEALYVSVHCLTIDTFCATNGEVDVIKVDTEGHENLVLDGATEMLGYGPTWLIEFHSAQNYTYCHAMLEGYGYDVQTIRHPHYTPESSMWYQHGWIRANKR